MKTCLEYVGRLENNIILFYPHGPTSSYNLKSFLFPGIHFHFGLEMITFPHLIQFQVSFVTILFNFGKQQDQLILCSHMPENISFTWIGSFLAG
jgi:hypothetical protein